MNGRIEQAFYGWLSARGITAPIFCGASADTIPPETSCVVVDASECKRIVGNLIRGKVIITATSPFAHITAEAHRELSGALSDVLFAPDGTSKAQLAEACTAAGLTLGGTSYESETPAHDGGRWQAQHEIIVGLLNG